MWLFKTIEICFCKKQFFSHAIFLHLFLPNEFKEKNKFFFFFSPFRPFFPYSSSAIEFQLSVPWWKYVMKSYESIFSQFQTFALKWIENVVSGWWPPRLLQCHYWWSLTFNIVRIINKCVGRLSLERSRKIEFSRAHKVDLLLRANFWTPRSRMDAM